MLFVCNISMENSSFEDGSEIQRILNRISGTLGYMTNRPSAGRIQDSNGSDCGYWEIQGTAQDEKYGFEIFNRYCKNCCGHMPADRYTPEEEYCFGCIDHVEEDLQGETK